MCATCGCEGDAKTTMLNLQTGAETAISGGHDPHEHVHADGTRHSHVHDHADAHSHENETRHHGHDQSDGGHHHDHAEPHVHDHAHAPAGEVHSIERRILAKNDALASKIRAWLAGREILAVNLVSSPGSGKTSLLERTIPGLTDEVPLFVIEGDQASSNDGKRIRSAGAPVVQINTGTGCHLDAEMIARGLSELKPGPGSIVFIENVGNLVCPALFDLGERAKVVIFSATEGEDKPLKYPHMFSAATLIILNKTDLLPHLDFSVEQAIANVRRVNPNATMLQISARTGEGLDAWFAWIRGLTVEARQFGFV
jgi:hydrogenase nickel incorporation protein HypB